MYQWNFIVAEDTCPLLGADFLRSNSPLVDIKGKRLVDAATYHSAPLSVASSPAPHLHEVALTTDRYGKLLEEFPEIMTPNFTQAQTKHRVEALHNYTGASIQFMHELVAYRQIS